MSRLRRLAARIRGARTGTPRPVLPVQPEPGFCTDCWVPPGCEHTLSCPEVEPEQAMAYLAWRDRLDGAR